MDISERSEAKRAGDRLQPNSGRGKHRKGDAINGEFVIDYKEYSKGIRITPDIWAKISTDAWRVDPDKYPMLKLILGEGASKLRLSVMQTDDEQATRRPEGCTCDE
jgi:hypothetical protein